MFMPQPKPTVYISAQQFYDHVTMKSSLPAMDDDTRIVMKLSKANDSIAWCCLDIKNMVGTGGMWQPRSSYPPGLSGPFRPSLIKALSAPGTIPALILIATYYTMRGFGKRMRQESMTHYFLYAADNQIYDSDWAVTKGSRIGIFWDQWAIKLCDSDMSAVLPPNKRKYYYNLMLRRLNNCDRQ